MISRIQIAGFFDHHYLQRKSIDILNFLHGASYQEKATCETSTFGLTGIGMPSRPQICLELPVVPLVGMSQMARLKIVQNERLIDF